MVLILNSTTLCENEETRGAFFRSIMAKREVGTYENAEAGSRFSLTTDAEESRGRSIATSRITKGLNGKWREEGGKRIMVIVKVITPPLFMIVILCC